jgi:hypothetical protein
MNLYNIFKHREIIAFNHIPKTAGTTLQHLLRANFFLRYCEVRILSKRSTHFFQKDDLIRILITNPLIKCISGHAVRPYGSLIEAFEKIKFITLLRNPVDRYISHYLYRIEVMRDELKDFNAFLNKEWTFNVQTKRIAGVEDLNKAKEILTRHFKLVGLVEEFDGFLILLKKKLYPMNFRINYKPKNVGKKNSINRKKLLDNIEKYKEKIKERNRLDIELYEFVKEHILYKEKISYGTDYETDLSKFKKRKKKDSLNLFRLLDYILRKSYYTPVFKFIRTINGLDI